MTFLDPRPEDNSPYYRGGYQPIPKSLSQLRVMAKKEAYRLELILKYKQQGRLLRLGRGSASLVAMRRMPALM